MKIQPAKGFTLIELILVITIIGVLVIPLLLTFRTTRTNQALLSSAEEFASQVRNVHVFARDAKDKKNWGIGSLSNNSYAVYTQTGVTRIQEKRYELERSIHFDSSFDVLFNIGTGETDSNLTVSFTADNGSKMDVTITKTGVVEIIPK